MAKNLTYLGHTNKHISLFRMSFLIYVLITLYPHLFFAFKMCLKKAINSNLLFSFLIVFDI